MIIIFLLMDLKSIDTNPQLYKESQAKRVTTTAEKELQYINIDKIIELYQQKIKLDFQDDMLRTIRNIINTQISNIKKAQKKNEYEQLVFTQLNEDTLEQIFNSIQSKETFNKYRPIIENLSFDDCLLVNNAVKNFLNENKIKRNDGNELLETLYNSLGNVLHSSVPENKDRVMLQVTNHKLLIDETKLLGHYDLTLKTQIANFSDAYQVAGNRGYYLIGLGVKLNRAIISYAMDFLEKEGYIMYETPHMMLETALNGLAQLEDFQDTLYKCAKSNDDREPQYLIATSEQPLTAMFRNKLLQYKTFPLKLGGLSHCYRKEAGKMGKDTLGLFRVHQFEKVEQFCVADQDNSWEIMEEMIKIAQRFYDSLGLSYQIINVHSQDLNNAAAMKYDLEGYFPGADTKYRELVSCSNCTDYISKKIHTKDDKERYVHMLNATLCANTRTICCILETYQTETGINIPDVLIPYMGGITEIPFIG